jgi:hypothetical protein
MTWRYRAIRYASASKNENKQNSLILLSINVSPGGYGKFPIKRDVTGW